ncbi:hypothetical protein [Thermococcus thioreducens]|nr:hypothetical protein [Thermococcus thioreducens]ASJ13226.1 hypothetical protein A3L14_10180 [Thermococcus thioreducens]
MIATALLVEAILVAIFAMALKRRNRFVSHYPEFRKFYDYGILAFMTLAVSKGVFLLLDLNDHGVLELSQDQSAMINSAGNLLLLIALLMYVLGWVRLLDVLTEKYEIVPVIEFAGGENHEALKPGLYLCNLPNCYPVIAKPLRGRAGLIVSRNPQRSSGKT